MARRWRIKTNKSLRDNAKLAVPRMLDDFLDRRDRVLAHPRLKNELHRMRLAGKTLRYAMEVFEHAFGGEFSSCLEQLKNLLNTMGTIHDCDVHVPKMQSYLREVRLFNRASPTPQDKIHTGPMTDLIREQLARRKSLFLEMTEIIEQWTRENFKGKVLQSMNLSIEAESSV